MIRVFTSNLSQLAADISIILGATTSVYFVDTNGNVTVAGFIDTKTGSQISWGPNVPVTESEWLAVFPKSLKFDLIETDHPV